MKKLNKSFKRFIKDVIKMIRKPVMSVLPGQLSFFLLLSLIPIIMITGLIASFFSISTDSIIDFISNSFPGGTSTLLIPLLSGRGIDYSIIILIVSALLLVSKGTRSIMRVASTLYGSEDTNTIKEIIKSFILAIILMLLITFIIVIPVLGGKVLELLHNFELVSVITDNIIIIYNLLKWPISIFIIFICIKIIYTISPNKKIPGKTVNVGSLFTTILWTLATSLYSFYITHFSNYNIFYGSASNIIVLMLWMYIISYIFVLGMSINASYIKSTE